MLFYAPNSKYLNKDWVIKFCKNGLEKITQNGLRKLHVPHRKIRNPLSFDNKGFYNIFNKTTTLIITAIWMRLIKMLMIAPFMPFSIVKRSGKGGCFTDYARVFKTKIVVPPSRCETFKLQISFQAFWIKFKP